MEIKEHAISGVFEFTPRVFTDARGAFFESFSARQLATVGITDEWVQDNQSSSARGVLRGLHFQKPPYAQAKLVRVAAGRALDIIVDIRPDSATYGQSLSVELDAQRCNVLYMPIGFAHGFVALEDDTLFLYKCSNYYHPGSEDGLHWNDPTLNINWQLTDPNVSDKDLVLPFFADFKSPF